MINLRWAFVIITLTVLTNHWCSGNANTEEVHKYVAYLNDDTYSDDVKAMLARFNTPVDELKRQQDE